MTDHETYCDLVGDMRTKDVESMEQKLLAISMAAFADEFGRRVADQVCLHAKEEGITRGHDVFRRMAKTYAEMYGNKE